MNEEFRKKLMAADAVAEVTGGFVNEEFRMKLMASVQERLRVIAGNEETLVEAWGAQHGFKPDECCIVRQDMQDGTTKMWVEKRGEFEELQRFRAREPLVQTLLDMLNIESGKAQATVLDAAKDVRDFDVHPL